MDINVLSNILFPLPFVSKLTYRRKLRVRGPFFFMVGVYVDVRFYWLLECENCQIDE